MTKSNLLLLILETMNDDNWPQYRYALFALLLLPLLLWISLKVCTNFSYPCQKYSIEALKIAKPKIGIADTNHCVLVYGVRFCTLQLVWMCGHSGQMKKYTTQWPIYTRVCADCWHASYGKSFTVDFWSNRFIDESIDGKIAPWHDHEDSKLTVMHIRDYTKWMNYEWNNKYLLTNEINDVQNAARAYACLTWHDISIERGIDWY